jgi:hypothetical protein
MFPSAVVKPVGFQGIGAKFVLRAVRVLAAEKLPIYYQEMPL